jgi:hypothetical protein
VTPSLHDMLARDLAHRLNSMSDPPVIAVPEVTVDTKQGFSAKLGSRRFDVVAVHLQSRRACVFEVKTSRQDALGWISGRKYQCAISHGAAVALACPASMGKLDLPDAVSRVDNDGAWRFDSSTITGGWGGPVSAELLIGVLRSLRQNRLFWRAVAKIGAPLVDSLLEQETS